MMSGVEFSLSDQIMKIQHPSVFISVDWCSFCNATVTRMAGSGSVVSTTADQTGLANIIVFSYLFLIVRKI